MLAVEIEVDDDLEKLPDNDGPPCRVLSEMPRIGVDQRRINAGKVQRAQSFADEGEEAPRTLITFEVGEKVKVNDGPFEDFDGLVEEVDDENQRLKVTVSIFGRATPVELEYGQVEKL